MRKSLVFCFFCVVLRGSAQECAMVALPCLRESGRAPETN
jgi:hypothetical protein